MRKGLMTKLLVSCSMAAVLGMTACGSTTASNDPVSNEYVEVKQYIGLKVPVVEKVEVTDEMVDSTIDSKLASSTTYEKVDRAAADGDTVNIDFVGKVDGKEFDGGSSEGFDLVLGSGTFIAANGDYKGFEEQIVGHKAGEKFDIEVQFPDNYVENLAGKAATFTITLNEVKEAKTPELTDDVVATLSTTSKTVADYKKEIKKQLEDQNEETYKNTLQSEAVVELLANVTVVGDLQSEMDEYYDQQYNYYKSYAEMYGMDMDTFLQGQMGVTEEQFTAQLKDSAEKSIKFKYACNLIAEDAKLTISDDEFKTECQKLAEEYGFTDSAPEASTAEEASTEVAKTAGEQFVEQYGEEMIRDYINQQNVVEFITEKCVQSEDATTEGAPETTEATDAAEATTQAK